MTLQTKAPGYGRAMPQSCKPYRPKIKWFQDRVRNFSHGGTTSSKYSQFCDLKHGMDIWYNLDTVRNIVHNFEVCKP